MNSLKARITEIFSEAFKECGYESSFGLVVESQRPDLGQFQCNGALALAKSVKKNPLEIAQNIVETLKNHSFLKNLSITGSGFINITVENAFILECLKQISIETNLANQIIDKPKTIVIDFGGPNIAKPMHVGHLRSAIIGDCLQRLFSFLGHNVISDNHVGDWGTQMGMLICELKRRQPNLLYFDISNKGPYPESPPLSINDLEEMYPLANKRCKEDEESMTEAVSATNELQEGREGYIALWKHFVALSTETLKNDFNMLGITFNLWLGESFYTERMEKLIKKLKSEGYAINSEGALIIQLEGKSNKKKMLPLMLVKSGGGYLYGTSEITTIEYRINNLHANTILYVVDKRQSLHFEQVFLAAYKTGIANHDIVLEHVGFGTVNGKDGKPFKTREGGIMKLNELIEQVTQKAVERMKEAGIAQSFSNEERMDIAHKVGIATLKFADLMNHRTSDYVFDIDKFSRFEGKTGPYLLYTAVRIKSILRKAKKSCITAGEIIAPKEYERDLMLILNQIPDVLKKSEEGFAPNYLCDLAYNLAKEFNKFYNECHILREKDKLKQGSWLALAVLCLKELELLLSLLGIEIPERM